MCSFIVFSVIGGIPITFLPVKPVPTPKIVRPGANSFMVAIEWAVTGAILFPRIATSGPILICRV